MIHFLSNSGEDVADESIVEKVYKDGDRVQLVNGEAPVYVEEEVKIAEEKKEETIKQGNLRCKNFGCQQFYNEEDNSDTSCSHHVLPPLFHDTRKGWTCCKDKMVYDWDEFQQIPPCSKGKYVYA